MNHLLEHLLGVGSPAAVQLLTNRFLPDWPTPNNDETSVPVSQGSLTPCVQRALGD